MNEGSESSAVLTPEQTLLLEGCKSYLDVMHATNAFQTRVCNAARDVIGASHDRISKIAKLAEPLKALANAYVYPAVADNNFDGSEAWVGVGMWLDSPVWAQLYLALVSLQISASPWQLVRNFASDSIATFLGCTQTARSMMTPGIGLRLNYDGR